MTKRYVDTSSELAYLRADLLRPVQFGAMVTLKIAARAPEAGRAIVLEDPPLFIHQAPRPETIRGTPHLPPGEIWDGRSST